MSMTDRRQFLVRIASITGGAVLMPHVTACGASAAAGEPTSMPAGGTAASHVASADTLLPIPMAKPDGWDPIGFNRERGNAGAIPESYHADINGPDGENSHLGKHLPYVPGGDLPVPEGYIALMWGDPALGHTMHPNAVRNESNNYEGHWYNWIRIRKATDGDAIEMQSEYTEWPDIGPNDNGAYAVFGADDITAESGKHTVYLAALPDDVGPGDTIRIYAHCLTHGEYVDFMTI